MKVSVVYEGPIPAPIAAGSQLATLRVSAADMDDVTIPLYAAQDVEQLGLFRKIGAAVEYLVWGAVADRFCLRREGASSHSKAGRERVRARRSECWRKRLKKRAMRSV